MKETIFMVHGMWLNSSCWELYRSFFTKKGYRCVIPTLPYHDLRPGEEPDPRLGTVSLTDYTDFLESRLKTVKGPVILMGHSMGGLLAQLLAARGYGKALVLLTPDPPAGIFPLTPSVIKSNLSSMMKWGFWRKPYKPSMKEVAYSMMQLLPFRQQKAFYDKLVFESGRAACEVGFWYLNPRTRTWIDKKSIQCPVYIVGALQDRMVPASVVRKIYKKYRHAAVYREYPNHSHWVINEPGWQEIVEDIHAWLARTLKKSRDKKAKIRNPR